jgi:hypothetical protein
MSDWFVCTSWLETHKDEVHFEIANEDGDQFFFSVHAEDIHSHIKYQGEDALDTFRYAEDDMLSLAVALIDDDYCEEGQNFHVSRSLFKRYFVS